MRASVPVAATLSLAISHLASAQVAPPARGRPPTEVLMPASGIDVPITAPGDRPIVEAWIDGRGPFRLGIETGNPMAVTLFVDALPRLGSAAPDTSRPFPQQLDSLRIGRLTLRGVDVAVPGPSPLPTQLDGQLGLAAYANLLLTVDVPHHRLHFSEDTLAAADDSDIVSVSHAGPLLSIPVAIGTRHAALILDTQGGVGLSVRPDQGTTLPTTTPPIVVGSIRSPALGTVSRTMARLSDDVRIGPVNFQRPFITFAPLPPGLPADGLIGIHALKFLRISLDQRTGRMRIRGMSRDIPPPVSYRDRGISVRYGRGPLVVAGVVDGTPAALAGLMAADTITQADGRATTSFAPSDWEPLAQSAHPLALVIEHEGTQRSVTLPPHVFVP